MSLIRQSADLQLKAGEYVRLLSLFLIRCITQTHTHAHTCTLTLVRALFHMWFCNYVVGQVAYEGLGYEAAVIYRFLEIRRNSGA